MAGFGKIRVYYWKYDDGTIGYAVRQTRDDKKEWLEAKYCSNQAEFKRFRTEAKRKCSTVDIKFKKCRLAGGLDDVCLGYFPGPDAAQSAAGISAMKQLLDSGGTTYKVFLDLVSAVLAGYCARVCCNYYKVERIQDKYKHAPVVSVSHADYAYYVLEKIADSLAVDTSSIHGEAYMFKSKPLRSKYQRILPKRQSDRSLTDCIYLKLAKSRFRVMPQYRDTTVLVHCRFFSGSEIAELQRRNIWTSWILYAVPEKKLLSTPVRINGKVLASSNCLWDTKDLNYVVQRYVSYLARKSQPKKWAKRIKKYFQDAEQVIAQHNTSANHPSIPLAEKYQTSLRLLALRLFLDSCKNDGGLSKEEAAAQLAAWYQVMLPGCSLEKIQKDCEQDDWDTPEPFQAQFESVIRQILQADDFKHICVSKGNICPEKSDNAKIEYWAYVKYHEPKGKNKSPFLSLRLRKETFEKLFFKYYENYRGKDLSEDLCDLDTEYKWGVTKARMYRNEDDKKKRKTVEALILNIDRMSFLPQEVVDRLHKIFKDHEPSDSKKA